MLNRMLLHYSCVLIIVFMFNIMICYAFIFVLDYEISSGLKEALFFAAKSCCGLRIALFKQNSGFLLEYNYSQ